MTNRMCMILPLALCMFAQSCHRQASPEVETVGEIAIRDSSTSLSEPLTEKVLTPTLSALWFPQLGHSAFGRPASLTGVLFESSSSGDHAAAEYTPSHLVSVFRSPRELRHILKQRGSSWEDVNWVCALHHRQWYFSKVEFTRDISPWLAELERDEVDEPIGDAAAGLWPFATVYQMPALPGFSQLVFIQGYNLGTSLSALAPGDIKSSLLLANDETFRLSIERDASHQWNRLKWIDYEWIDQNAK